jgi:hypothetical protein
MKHVGVLKVYKILFIRTFCVFVGLNNKMYIYIAYLYVDNNIIDYYFTIAYNVSLHSRPPKNAATINNI